MQRLLLDLHTEGYPRDFLLARLRGRSRILGKVTVGHQRRVEDPWGAMQGELSWLYRTMDRKTREEFGFCFLYFELRRLLIALRRLAEHSREGVSQLAVLPLLNRELVQLLQEADEVRDAVRLLDAALAKKEKTEDRLEQILIAEGHRQMEEALVDSLFSSALCKVHKPPLRRYFGQLVDLHNLLSILKTRRWEFAEQRPLLGGGTHTPQQWQSLLRPAEEPKLRLTVNRISGSDRFDAESVEHAMLGHILRTLQRRARTEPDPFLIFNYLWGLYLQTRNLGLQRWGGDQLAAWERLG